MTASIREGRAQIAHGFAFCSDLSRFSSIPLGQKRSHSCPPRLSFIAKSVAEINHLARLPLDVLGQIACYLCEDRKAISALAKLSKQMRASLVDAKGFLRCETLPAVLERCLIELRRHLPPARLRQCTSEETHALDALVTTKTDDVTLKGLIAPHFDLSNCPDWLLRQAAEGLATEETYRALECVVWEIVHRNSPVMRHALRFLSSIHSAEDEVALVMRIVIEHNAESKDKMLLNMAITRVQIYGSFQENGYKNLTDRMIQAIGDPQLRAATCDVIARLRAENREQELESLPVVVKDAFQNRSATQTPRPPPDPAEAHDPQNGNIQEID